MIMARHPESTGKALLVDDDPAFLRVLSRALSRKGLEILTAEDQAAALEIAGAENPEFAVVDLKLESESGLDLIPCLKDCVPEIKIVVLTGYASIATAVEAIKRGASNYLAKPATTDEIFNALTGNTPQPTGDDDYRPMSVERLEWEHIQKVLKENDGNISATARSLGMYRRTLQRKLAKKPVAN